MKSPLLLLHGALGSADQFDKLLPLFPAGLQTYAINLPGHGGAPLAGRFSIEHFADAVRAFLDEKAIAQAQIFGYSMGGYTALHLASQHPDRIQKIITLGTKFDWTPEISARETALLNPDKIVAKVPVFANLLEKRHAPADWRMVLQNTAQLLTALGNGAALQPNALRAIPCPVLIGLGTEDHLVTAEESREAAKLLQKGHFELLEDVKHPIEQIDPAFLVNWLLKFLAEK